MQLQGLLFVSVSLLPFLGHAAPATSAKPSAAAASSSTSSSSSSSASASATANASAPAANVSDTQIANAVMSWQNDTAKVTKFLNTATSLTGDEYTRQATIALNAEVDELNHKMILDAAMGQMQTVMDANDVLATQGTFQAVVDTLQAMVNDGPDTAQANVNIINNNRCVNVLPNIDKYFAAAGSSTVSAARPTGCLEVQGAPTAASAPASGQAQGNGAVQDAAATSSTSSSAAASTSATTKAAAASASAPKASAASASSSATKASAAATSATTSKASAAAAGSSSSASATTKAASAASAAKTSASAKTTSSAA